MAIDLNGFDATTIEPAASFDPIPAGAYLAAIVATEDKTTRAGTGEYLELTFEILEGAYKGRRLWARLNLKNTNAQAVEIARRELSAICRAIGVLKPSVPADLHNLPLIVKVKLRRREDTGEMTNEVAGYEPKAAANGAAVTAPPSNTTPKWMRQK